jgi:hypothetical protein
MDDDAPVGLDPSMLPPAISISRDESISEVESGDAEAKPRRRAPRKKPVDDEAGGTLESIG